MVAKYNQTQDFMGENSQKIHMEKCSSVRALKIGVSKFTTPYLHHMVISLSDFHLAISLGINYLKRC